MHVIFLIQLYLPMCLRSLHDCKGLCPDWEDWDDTDPVKNAAEAMKQADEWLGVPQVSNLEPFCFFRIV